MNTRYFNQLIIGCLILIQTIISGCFLDQKTHCPPDEFKSYFLTQADKDKVPYNGFDTLTFLNINTNDTHFFIGTGISQGFVSTTYKLNDECPGGHADLETIRYTFLSNTLPDKLNLDLHISYNGKIPTIETNYKKNVFTSITDQLNPPFSFDSIKIQSKYYYNVNMVYNIDQVGNDNFFQLYNKNEGIIKMQLTDGSIWELINKK